MSTTAKERTARKARRCSDCRLPIEPGQRYRLWTAFPHDGDLGNERFYSINECSACAARRGCPLAAVSS